MGKRGVFVAGVVTGAIGAVIAVVVIGIWSSGFQARAEWVPWGVRGFIEEQRLVSVPVRSPYPPGSACFGGYLTRLDATTRKFAFMLDERGRPVECFAPGE